MESWQNHLFFAVGSVLVVISLIDELMDAYTNAFDDHSEKAKKSEENRKKKSTSIEEERKERPTIEDNQNGAHESETRGCEACPDLDLVESEPCSCGRCSDCIKMSYQRNLKGVVPFAIHFTIAILITAAVFLIIKHDKSYYEEDVKGVSGTTVNIYGAAIAAVNERGQDWKVWDANDIAVPAEENTEFFITTKIVKTRNQTRSVCPERTWIKEARCRNDSDCLPVGTALGLGSGLTNGTCNVNTSTCFVHAWCPIEYDTLHSQAHVEMLNGTGDFLVLIKNHVYFEFPDGFSKGHGNIASSSYRNNEQLCNYDETTDNTCPYFRVDDIVTKATSRVDTSATTFKEFAAEGGVVSIRIKWRCDMDGDIRNCQPSYHFRRLDRDHERVVASGYNYSDVIGSYDDENKRDLIRATGFLFIIEVDAIGSRFSYTKLATRVGAAFGLMRSAKSFKNVLVMLWALCSCIYCCFLCKKRPTHKNNPEVQAPT